MNAINNLLSIIRADYYRNFGTDRISFLRILINPRIRFFFLFRSLNFSLSHRNHLFQRVFFWILERSYNGLQLKLSIDIPYECQIGRGLFLPHMNGIVINKNTTIGENCTILHQVTIGNNMFKSLDNVAIIGNNVQVGAGAKIVGPITIGDNVTIGANAVVVKNIDDNSVVGGVPAVTLSNKVSKVYNDYSLQKKEK